MPRWYTVGEEDEVRGKEEKRKKEENKMTVGFIVAMVVAIPIILFPAAFIWYMNIGGIVHALKEARAKERKLGTVTTQK